MNERIKHPYAPLEQGAHQIDPTELRQLTAIYQAWGLPPRAAREAAFSDCWILREATPRDVVAHGS